MIEDESDQIIKIIGKYILLCNFFVLSRIEFALIWDDRHQPNTSILW